VSSGDVAARWQALREALEAERLRVQEQIGAYPPPIPACDAYFNFLLEQRALLGEELARLEEARRECPNDAGADAAYDAFVDSLRTEVGPAQ
jgi:hypothetical protein